MPIERAIAESRFVYGAKAASFGMSRPPGTLPLEAFGEQISQLFERAFAPPSEAARPTAAQWVEALQSFEAQLVGCTSTRSHYFPPGPGGCCWCGLEQQTGLKLFGGKEASFDAFGTAKLAPIWDAISAVARPEPVRPLAVPVYANSEARSEDPLGYLPRVILSWLLVFLSAVSLLFHPGEHLLLAAMTFGSALALRWRHRKPPRHSKHAESMQRGLFAARKHLADLTREWNELCVDDRIEQLMAKLTQTKQQVLELAARRESSVQSLTQVVMNQQRMRYLEQFRIDKAMLPNVSERDIRTLEHYDVDTADDIFRPGVYLTTMVSVEAGQVITAWAKACARNFKFDPARAVDPTDVQTIEGELLQQQDALLAALQKGREDLEQMTGDLAARRDTKQRELAAAQKALTMASQVEKQ
jgi:DNA-binding helix-hairpin-helix protein with protein kinase domain